MRALVAVSAAILYTAAKATVPSRPNFLVFITDDQDITLSGIPKEVMPTVRKELITGGMQFSNSFVSSPICCPSRTSTLSGRYSHNLDDQDLGWCGDFKSIEGTTWVPTLSDSGYQTGLFGKYYNQYDDFCGANVHVPRGWGRFFTMCDDSKFFNNTFNDQGIMVEHGDAPADYMTSVIGNQSMAWLKRVAGNATAAPFFGYIALHGPHVPATPAPWVWGTPLASTIAPRVPNYDAHSPEKQWVVAHQAPLAQQGLVNYTDDLFSRRLLCLVSVDDIVAEAVAVLEATGTLGNTFIIFTSDHGYNLGTFRLASGKFHPYENDIRVPLFVAGPGVTPGSVADAIVSNLDLGPTVLDLAGLAPPGGADGRSYASMLQTPLAELVPTVTAEGEEALRGQEAGGSASGPIVVVDDGDARRPLRRVRVPAGWRDRFLIEYWSMGYVWRGPCTNGSAPCPDSPEALLDAPGNTWAMLRVLNATHDTAYVEFRGRADPPQPVHTNWTEAYNVNADPWQTRNLAPLRPAELAPMAAEMWALVNCSGAACFAVGPPAG